MLFSPERRARLTYVTASHVSDGRTNRQIVVESRPEYAIIQLKGTKIQYPIAWTKIFALAEDHHQHNLRIEAAAAQRVLDGRKQTHDLYGMGHTERRITRIQAGRRIPRARKARPAL